MSIPLAFLLMFHSIIFAVKCTMGNVEYFIKALLFISYTGFVVEYLEAEQFTFCLTSSSVNSPPLLFCFFFTSIYCRICIPRVMDNLGICVWAPLVSSVDFISSILLFQGSSLPQLYGHIVSACLKPFLQWWCTASSLTHSASRWHWPASVERALFKLC